MDLEGDLSYPHIILFEQIRPSVHSFRDAQSSALGRIAIPCYLAAITRGLLGTKAYSSPEPELK